ncbi:hypothetical protein HS041_17155 [Planomonospora sp. ID67723]|uniref:hypothetical protein n=1 Tax=Planomonospora sp. ID67723 TaxID=2738134 RepID=UPI0018C41AAA|nr:hypothetical protein [Planomonospora sp. ID67723]MBG0829496.1 hypothetical protein [Planomonospora sp. ID67723]
MLETSISEASAWARVVPDDAVAAFGKEFAEMLHGCAELGRFAPLGTLVAGWRRRGRCGSPARLPVTPR